MSKPALSGRVLGLKFMQKANNKKELQRAEELEQVETDKKLAEEGHGAAPAAMQGEASSSKRCVIIYENAPQAAPIGRFKFTARSPAEAEAEAAAEQLEKKKAKVKTTSEEVEELSISDTDLAKAFRRGPAAHEAEDAAGGKKKKARTK